MQKWEYLVEDEGWRGGGSDLEGQLNHLGEEGWELISVYQTPSMTHGQTLYYFKRPKTD